MILVEPFHKCLTGCREKNNFARITVTNIRADHGDVPFFEITKSKCSILLSDISHSGHYLATAEEFCFKVGMSGTKRFQPNEELLESTLSVTSRAGVGAR